MKKNKNIITKSISLMKRISKRMIELKFGLSYIINIFSIPDFIFDKEVNIIQKLKLIFALGIVVIYTVSPIDIVPEAFAGIFGMLDDFAITIFNLNIMNDEIEKYKKEVKKRKKSNIIEDVDFEIKD